MWKEIKFSLKYHLIIYLCQNFTWTNNINMRSGSSLLPPTIGMLKWNVNASSSYKPRPSRIDGVLRDCEGRFLCFFFLFHEAEVLVIQKAMLFSIDCCHASTNQLVVESNSHNAITYIKGTNAIRSWHLQTKFNDISNACNRLHSICFEHVHKKRIKLQII
jgi:hypothetical protein